MVADGCTDDKMKRVRHHLLHHTLIIIVNRYLQKTRRQNEMLNGNISFTHLVCSLKTYSYHGFSKLRLSVWKVSTGCKVTDMEKGGCLNTLLSVLISPWWKLKGETDRAISSSWLWWWGLLHGLSLQWSCIYYSTTVTLIVVTGAASAIEPVTLHCYPAEAHCQFWRKARRWWWVHLGSGCIESVLANYFISEDTKAASFFLYTSSAQSARNSPKHMYGY